MNKPLRRAAIFCLALIVALMGWVTWLQGAKAGEYKEDPHNPRVAIGKYAAPMGNILVGGEPVTGSAATSSTLKYKRTYKDGSLYAPVTGFTSQIFGSNQLENLYGDLLDGSDSRLQSPADALTRTRAKGGDVVTAIDPAVQKAGQRALGGKKGAALAMDPATGRVLGMVSTPSYDPGKFAGSGSADQKAWKKMSGDSDHPEVNRALRQPLPPGSTFKLVVAAAALENGLYSSVDEATAQPRPVHPPAHPHQAHQRERLRALQERGHPHRAPVLLQHRLREDGRRPGQGQGEGAGREVRLQRREGGHPGAGRHEPLPLRHGRGTDRAVRDRPVRRPGDPAPDGDDLLGHRERRRAEDPAAGRRADRRRRHHRPGLRPQDVRRRQDHVGRARLSSCSRRCRRSWTRAPGPARRSAD